jgi:hypothetical protein
MNTRKNLRFLQEKRISEPKVLFCCKVRTEMDLIIGSEFTTAVNMKSCTSWDVTPVT